MIGQCDWSVWVVSLSGHLSLAICDWSVRVVSLMGQFADDGSFVINEHTGEVFATRALDRDPPGGRAVWNFNVLAHDEINGYRSSLTGYAEVRVIPRDVNDNAPVFDQNRLVGRVPEHSLFFNALTLLVGLCSL